MPGQDYSKNGGPRKAVRPDDGRLTRSGAHNTNPVRRGERKKVAELARYCTSRQIALILRGVDHPVSKDWVCDHFKKELEWGKAHMIETAGGKLVDAILAGKESSIHFALRTLGDPGQFVERKEVAGPGGGPIQTVDLAVLANLPLEKLRALANAAAIFAGDTGDLSGETAPVSDAAGPDRGGD